MTKMNWEKAKSRERYLNSIFSVGDYFDEVKKSDVIFDVNNPSHNPLGLGDEHCSGKVPNEEIRVAIFKYLVEKDSRIKSRFVDEWTLVEKDSKMSAKQFTDFSWRLFLMSLDWPDGKCPLENVMPIAVCFSIIWLKAYNESVSKSERRKRLTSEILRKTQEIYKNNRI